MDHNFLCTCFMPERLRIEKNKDGIDIVTEYFSSLEQILTLKSEIQVINVGNEQGDLASLEAKMSMLQKQRMTLEDMVEKTVERQIKETLARQGIFNPIDKYIRLEVGFPPVNFELSQPPYLLVLSPRYKIETIREIILMPNLSLKEIEDINMKKNIGQVLLI